MLNKRTIWIFDNVSECDNIIKYRISYILKHILTLPSFTIGLWEISWQLELQTRLFNFCGSNNLSLYSRRVFIHMQHLSKIIKLLLTQTAYATHRCTDVTISNILSLSLCLNVVSPVVYKSTEMIPDIKMLTCWHEERYTKLSFDHTFTQGLQCCAIKWKSSTH